MMAKREKIVDLLYPLFVKDINSILSQLPQLSQRESMVLMNGFVTQVTPQPQPLIETPIPNTININANSNNNNTTNLEDRQLYQPVRMTENIHPSMATLQTPSPAPIYQRYTNSPPLINPNNNVKQLPVLPNITRSYSPPIGPEVRTINNDHIILTSTASSASASASANTTATTLPHLSNICLLYTSRCV